MVYYNLVVWNIVGEKEPRTDQKKEKEEEKKKKTWHKSTSNRAWYKYAGQNKNQSVTNKVDVEGVPRYMETTSTYEKILKKP